MGRHTDLSDHNPLAIRRVAAGLTQTQLAEKSGVKRKQIAMLEAGQIIPRRSTAIKIAKALECNPEDIVWWSIPER